MMLIMILYSVYICVYTRICIYLLIKNGVIRIKLHFIFYEFHILFLLFLVHFL